MTHTGQKRALAQLCRAKAFLLFGTIFPLSAWSSSLPGSCQGRSSDGLACLDQSHALRYPLHLFSSDVGFAVDRFSP